jgi:hypothetical protein
MPTFYECYTDRADRGTPAHLDTLANNMRDHEHEIIHGMQGLSSIANALSATLLNETELQQSVDQTISTLNAIVAAKQIEHHNIHVLLGENNITASMQEIVNMWTIIRQSLAKYKYSQRYNHNKMIDISRQLHTLTQLEQSYYEALLGFLNRGS